MTAIIGLISDTHGLVRPSVHDALAGVELILHAGDVGGEEILAELETIAPVKAVFGNTDPPDHGGLVTALDLVVHGVHVHVSHGHEIGRKATPETRAVAYPDADVVVYGHTHIQRIDRVGRKLVVNPGAAGPRRFELIPTVAKLTITGGVPDVELIPLAE